MQIHIPDQRIEEIVKQCLSKGLILPEDNTSKFIDFEMLDSRIYELQRCFPPETLHTAAIKANPLSKVLEYVASQDFGLEAASMGELLLADTLGVQPEKIVFDSPAKTVQEIEYALKKGIHINADNFHELERINDIYDKVKSTSKVGLRLNPQVGIGSIESTSVAGVYSKFGIPIQESRDQIIEKFKQYKWLTGIHIHIGSQAIQPDMLLAGAEIALELISEINTHITHRVEYFDIGGGLPISYHKNTQPPDMEKYASDIFKLIEKFGLEDLKIITEFGRYLFVNAGFTISKVEYVKENKEVKTAIIHVGADLFLREALQPQHWKHDFSVLKSDGTLRNGIDDKPYYIAGPLCFAGDIIAKEITLPEVSQFDYIVIHDTGGYTFGMWSKYLSRQFPKIIGYTNDNSVEIIRKRENLDESIKQWF